MRKGGDLSGAVGPVQFATALADRDRLRSERLAALVEVALLGHAAEIARRLRSRLSRSSCIMTTPVRTNGDAPASECGSAGAFVAGQGAKAQKIVLKKQAPTLGPAA
jgi:hypothetical protein